ncbi:glycosyl hydrolase [Seongchinamella sediminis]|uniref:Glycosyl hydrolase n=1 Tax=Seongchinamella sediminis TaxID=2283635 RepID=A0A3L7E377_9GAMM|nr:YCF48-related protein [Seongchinamella sediminis]RLQ22841.1 glycosyl hydrolase [Seongchinamella sediminis]
MGIRKTLVALCAGMLLTPWTSVLAEKSYDVLELPAVPSELAEKSLVFAIHKYFDRYFAVGHRGHILYSEDGENWTQAEVPVRSSLLDIHFPTPELGWAVGHEGVILHSADAGKTWTKQYDGLRYGEEGLAYYQELATENPDNEDYPFLVEEMEFAISQGADKPLFKVFFHDAQYGHVFGAYGMMLKTEDGGQSWEHVLHTTENDSFYHLFDYAHLPGDARFFLSGEAGLFMIGDAREETAVMTESVPWQGSFFTSAASASGAVVLGGLRGRMFRTEDEGSSWQEVEKPPTSSIVDSTMLDDGRMVVAGIAGELLISGDDGRSFNFLPLASGSRVYTVSPGPSGSLLVGGPAGIKKLQLPQ